MVEYAKKLHMESVGSAGEEYVYFFNFFTRPRECKPVFLHYKNISQLL
jgi:hypothetical protein